MPPHPPLRAAFAAPPIPSATAGNRSLARRSASMINGQILVVDGGYSIVA